MEFLQLLFTFVSNESCLADSVQILSDLYASMKYIKKLTGVHVSWLIFIYFLYKSISVEILIRCCRASAYISEILLSIVVISLLLHSHYNQLILRTITFLQKHGKHLLAFTLHLDK